MWGQVFAAGIEAILSIQPSIQSLTQSSIQSSVRFSPSLGLPLAPKPSFLPPVKALLLTEYKKMSYVDVADPVCGADDVLIQVRACGICGSRHHRRRREREGLRPGRPRDLRFHGLLRRMRPL